jgi:hypothetical protein
MVADAVGTEVGGMSQDDLGAAMLRRHPRGGLWQQLDVTVANLTIEQTFRMAEAAVDDGRCEEARARVLAGLAGEVAGRMASRWVRWADTFGLPMLDPAADQAEQLAYPYRPADSPQRQQYIDAVLPLFDAALGILGAPADPQGEADFEVLTGPWRSVCLPSRFTPATAYGRHSQAALSVLRFAAGMPASWLRRMVTSRAGLDEQVWQDARVAADTAGIEAGYPYRTRSLYWESVPAAEQAAGRSPTDRELVDALWGAAVVQILPGQLDSATTALLCTPYRASGAVLPN